MSNATSSSKGGSGVGNKSLCERWKEDYDDEVYEDLTKEQLAFYNALDINFRGQIRRQFTLEYVLSQMYASD